MYTTIVVGTDGSERAHRAVERAVELAAAWDATLHIVHAYQGTREAIEDAAREVIARTAANIEASGVAVRTHAIQGDPADVVLDFAYDSGADLIVVGNRGMTGKRRILGSVPNAVAHDASCAVMIVPTHHDD